ncbi:MAG: pitrilysin family protein [Rikenellaceae bacterium]
MISYSQKILNNGLTVIVNRDRVSKLAAINILYKVGARNEDPSRTGFAHLFEHLMFRGTERNPNFDIIVQMASGENNAFTNNDYTDFYITLPKIHIETALELEADRMRGLALTPEKLELEKMVVVEEFKQRYLNQPYGDTLMLLRDMCYKVHPYRWATIGLTPEHIEAATMEDVESFYSRFYTPSNAILSISADIDEEEMFAMAERWFGEIEDSGYIKPEITPEPEQTQPRRVEVERDVPATYVTIAFPMAKRPSRGFHIADLVSDILAGGDSARLYQRLVKGKGLFSSVNAYITGECDPGLFLFTAQLLPSTSVEEAEAALWEEIEALKSESISDYELEKVKNKFEANTLFGEINVMNKAMNLGFYSMIGDLPLINSEVEIYRSIDNEQINSFARETLTREHSNTLVYRHNPNTEIDNEQE